VVKQDHSNLGLSLGWGQC